MAYGARRAPVKKRKGPVEQFAEDITHGTGEIIRMGKAAFERVKSGAQKTLKFLRK